jgi:murein endopeptidase
VQVRGAVATLILAPLIAGGAAAHAQTEPPPTGLTSVVERVDEGPIMWRRSTPVGATNRGFLIRGVQLPASGDDFFTWDPILGRAPNRGWRRWGADTTIRSLLRVLAAYRDAHPGAARIGIADISRPNGGPFGRRYGGLGHASHQNGLDMDIYYPRSDRQERSITSASQIDTALARDLVRRFVAAGSVYVFVGPRTGLAPRGRQTGRKLQRLVHHDDHMHVRFRPGGRGL